MKMRLAVLRGVTLLVFPGPTCKKVAAAAIAAAQVMVGLILVGLGQSPTTTPPVEAVASSHAIKSGAAATTSGLIIQEA